MGVCVVGEGCVSVMSYVTVLQETVQCLAFVNERISKQMIKVCVIDIYLWGVAVLELDSYPDHALCACKKTHPIDHSF